MTKTWHQQFKKSHKIHRTDRDGITHDSKSEMARWERLKLNEKAGQIRNLRRQVDFPLVRGGIRVLTRKGTVYKYRADFVYDEYDEKTREWVPVVEDHKGYFDRMAQLKIATFEALYGLKVRITNSAANG